MALQIEGLAETFGGNEDLIEDGAWMPIPGHPKMRIRLRSQQSRKVRDKASKLARRHLPLLKANQQIPREEIDKDRAELLATAVVTGWEEFRDKDTKQPIPCTPSNVREIMLQFPTLADVCTEWSDDLSNYRIEPGTKEDIEGNSGRISE